MPVTWSEDPAGRIRVVSTGNLKPKLFGMPFLAVAGYFIWHLGAGAAESMVHHEMLLTIPGTILGLVMIAAFGIPGWLLVAARRIVVIDPALSRVTETRDFRIVRGSGERPLREFSGVRIAWEWRGGEGTNRKGDSGAGRGGYRCFPVYLTPKGRKEEFEIAAADRQEDAGALAAAVAARTRFPLTDESGALVDPNAALE